MRHELAIIALLLLCVPGLHAQEDPAYVDSPANRARPDPARADGGGDGPAASASAEYAAAGSLTPDEEAASERERLAEIERRTAAQVAAAYRGHQQGMAAAMREQSYTDPPIGGHSLMDNVGRDRDHGFDPVLSSAPVGADPNASARRQIGSALTQDAAGLIDAKARNEIYGSNGPVYFPTDAHDR